MAADDAKATGRVRLLDVIRGFSVVSMVLFHFCYDLRYIAGLNLPWFQGALQDVWRASISWTFLLVAGMMCSFSHSNFRRSAKYGAFALVIYLATTVAAVDDPISFGIIYCMAACTLVAAALGRIGLAPRGAVAAAVLFVLFVICLRLPSGFVGVAPLAVRLPSALYSTELLSWLGFPGPRFVSGDYYPLLPYLFMYLTGMSIGPAVRTRAASGDIPVVSCAPLEWLGRHALLVYALHQPVLLALTMLVSRMGA